MAKQSEEASLQLNKEHNSKVRSEELFSFLLASNRMCYLCSCRRPP